MVKLKGFRRGVVMQSRKWTIYKFLKRKHFGRVPCFVCGEHVETDDATLEHIKPRARGGTDEMKNLSISHKACNLAKGCKLNH